MFSFSFDCCGILWISYKHFFSALLSRCRWARHVCVSDERLECLHRAADLSKVLGVLLGAAQPLLRAPEAEANVEDQWRRFGAGESREKGRQPPVRCKVVAEQRMTPGRYAFGARFGGFVVRQLSDLIS